ncbi:hypothetical protein D3C87_1732380 [compost metagenome]
MRLEKKAAAPKTNPPHDTTPVSKATEINFRVSSRNTRPTTISAILRPAPTYNKIKTIRENRTNLNNVDAKILR